jgi:hypothetical protein
LNKGNRLQFDQLEPPYIVLAITEFMKGQEKMNRAMLEQMHAINAQHSKLNAREQENERSNNASTSADHSELPSEPETRPREEAKAIT